MSEQKINASEVRGIAGLENFEDTSPQVSYIKILNGSAATVADLPAGTIVGKDDEVLANKGEPFIFVPIYIFTKYAIWNSDTRSLVKFSFSKSGNWSDGSPIKYEEVNFVGKVPPIATESRDIVILAVSELAKPEDERSFMILSIPIKNKFKSAFVKDLINTIAKSSVEQKVTEMYACAYSFLTEKVKDAKGNVWYEFSTPKFEKKIQDSTKELCGKIYNETKDLNKTTALVSTIVQPEDAATSSVEIVENPEF